MRGPLPGSSNPEDFDEALEILAHPEWESDGPWLKGEKVKVTNDTDGTVKYYLANKILKNYDLSRFKCARMGLKLMMLHCS